MYNHNFSIVFSQSKISLPKPNGADVPEFSLLPYASYRLLAVITPAEFRLSATLPCGSNAKKSLAPPDFLDMSPFAPNVLVAITLPDASSSQTGVPPAYRKYLCPDPIKRDISQTVLYIQTEQRTCRDLSDLHRSSETRFDKRW